MLREAAETEVAGGSPAALVGVELARRDGHWTVELRGDRIARIHRGRPKSRRSDVLELDGHLLLPGFHDPHVHILAMAKERDFVRLPRTLRGPGALAAELRARSAAAGAGTLLRVRGLDPDEMLGGWMPDRGWLDAVAGGRPVRLQHRNLRMDVLSSAALRRCGVDDSTPGVERASNGEPTGRIFGGGHALADRAARPAVSHLRRLVAAASAELLRQGVTSLQDAGEANGAAELDLLDALASEGALRQRLWTMVSGRRLAAGDVCGAGRPRVRHAKLVAAEAALDLDGLIEAALAARRRGLGVAIHAATEVELAAAVAVVEAARRADCARAPVWTYRIEHAFVASDELVAAVARAGAAVVATPRLVGDAGDGYLARHSSAEVASLHRLRAWLEAGVPLALASDAPVTSCRPLAMIASAVARRTASGRSFGPAEALDPHAALHSATRVPALLVGARRLGRVAVGAPADVVALRPGTSEVAVTILRGTVAHVAT